MDPELRHLLEENHALVKDNHRLLRAVRRHQILSAFWRVFLWLFVALVSGYFYVAYLSPLVAKFQAQNPTGSPSSSIFQNLLHSYGIGQ